MCTRDDPCGECDYGHVILSGESVFRWRDSRSQLCHDGSYLCGECQDVGDDWHYSFGYRLRPAYSFPSYLGPQRDESNFTLEMQ